MIFPNSCCVSVRGCRKKGSNFNYFESKSRIVFLYLVDDASGVGTILLHILLGTPARPIDESTVEFIEAKLSHPSQFVLYLSKVLLILNVLIRRHCYEKQA